MHIRVWLNLLLGNLPPLSVPDVVAISLVLLFFLCAPFVVWMIVDCARYESLDSDSRKHVWLLIILFAPGGSLIYFFARKRPRSKLSR